MQFNIEEFFNIVNQNIILSSLVYGFIILIITSIISIIVYIISKIIKKPVSFFVVFKLIYQFFLFSISSMFKKDKSDILIFDEKNKKHENEEHAYVSTWSLLEELIGSIQDEPLTSQQQYSLDQMTEYEKLIMQKIKKAFLDCLNEWNLIYNEMIQNKTIENENISNLRIKFRSNGKKITTLLENKKDIPKPIINKIINYHRTKLNKYIDFFLDKAVNELITENVKTKKHVILNVWVYGLTLFVEDRDYFVDMILNKRIDINEIKEKELEEKKKELERQQHELDIQKNNL